MAKDAKGHGSEGRGGSSFDNINAQRVKEGFKPMPEKNRGMHDFFDYMAGTGPKPDFMNAASAVVGTGPKSAPVDTHPAMKYDDTGAGHAARTQAWVDAASAKDTASKIGLRTPRMYDPNQK